LNTVFYYEHFYLKIIGLKELTIILESEDINVEKSICEIDKFGVYLGLVHILPEVKLTIAGDFTVSGYTNKVKELLV